MQQSNTRIVYEQPRILQQSQPSPSNTYSQGAYNTGGYRTSLPMDNSPLGPEKKTEVQNQYNPPGHNPVVFDHQPSDAQNTYSNNNYNQGGYNNGDYDHSVRTVKESSQPQDSEKRTEVISKDRFNQYGQTEFNMKNKHQEKQNVFCDGSCRKCCCECCKVCVLCCQCLALCAQCLAVCR